MSTQVSPTTAAARQLVAARLPAAEALGRDLAEFVDDPEEFTTRLLEGLTGLSDAACREGQLRVAPGITNVLGVRLPILATIRRSFDRASRQTRPDSLLWLADRLLREPALEARLVAIGIVGRVMPSDPERAWQLLRRIARQARDWITIDSLAHDYAKGILLEPYRWAEVEQLVYSPLAWERRLVASTIATLPFADRREGRRPAIAERALPVIGQLIGDNEPMVQKGLSWALRSLALADPEALARWCEQESVRAAGQADGARAWVIRDALPALGPQVAAPIRARLATVRRRTHAPSTSTAAGMAALFQGLPGVDRLAEPPLF